MTTSFTIETILNFNEVNKFILTFSNLFKEVKTRDIEVSDVNLIKKKLILKGEVEEKDLFSYFIKKDERRLIKMFRFVLPKYFLLKGNKENIFLKRDEKAGFFTRLFHFYNTDKLEYFIEN